MSFIWKDHYNKYIKLQRNYKHFTEEMLEKLIRNQQTDIATINSFLKNKPKIVLDIGCGLGIYDLALHDFYKEDIKFYLLDKTTTAQDEKKVYYGHREIASFYNNLNYTKEFLILNGISENNIECLSVDNDMTITNQLLQKTLSDVDLVISIISLGFHYPVKTYLDSIYNILNNDGLFCFNCRNLEENIPILLEKFIILYPSKFHEGSFLICRKK